MPCRSRKRFTEPVALPSTASVDFSPSGLAAFRVRPPETASTYSRSVLGAGGNLATGGAREQSSRETTAATSAKSRRRLASGTPGRRSLQTKTQRAGGLVGEDRRAVRLHDPHRAQAAKIR